MSISVVDYYRFEKTVLNSEVNIENFFAEYSKYYVQSTHDFLTISRDFCSVMQTLKDRFKYTDEEQKSTFERRITPFCASRRRLLNPSINHLNGQSPYVNILSRLISSKDSVLDVGGGAVPYSSILMTDYFKKVGAMDKFVISEPALNTTGIQSQNTYFDSTTSLEGYDYVVGKTPCTAIRSIVENCSKQNKGYLVKLCDCDLRNIALENDGVYKPWTEILPELDPNVKFDERRDYAFNLDISPSDFAKIEAESTSKDVFSLENSVFGELKEYEASLPAETSIANKIILT